MFYYPIVLKHRTGCFSTIWLVATKGIRVPRRDFLKVNVKSTCDDIMNYVLERVPPPRPGLPRPRFSLYLSSQLQYGVIIVYHRQCAILLEELHTIVAQLLKQRAAQKIDMDDQNRQALVLPNAMSLLEEAEGAQDPLFGVMRLDDMPSPNTLIQMGRAYLRGASPEHPEPTSPTAAVAQEIGITASPDSITLREVEPVAIPPAEFEGVDLVDQHPETLDFLLAQTDYFPEEEVTPGEQEREVERGGRGGDLERERERRGGDLERERERREGDLERERERREGDLERERARRLTSPTTELQPTTLPGDEAVLLPEEEEERGRPAPPPGQLTPVSGPPLPSPPSAASERGRRRLQLEVLEVPPPEVKRRRKRQLIFFDPETQISQEALQQQIDNPVTETRRLPTPPSVTSLSAAHLLNNPCNFLPEEVMFLWKQAATITPLSGSDLQVGDRGPESTDSEKERERETDEPAAEREEERPELSPREVQRDLAEPEMLDISGLASLILEGSDQRDVSREISPLHTSERDGSIVSRSVSNLQDIPEVMDEFLGEAAGEEFPGLLPAEHDAAPVLFKSLLPPDADRSTVSAIFQRLLENLSARKVRAEQQEPYGDILISSLGPDHSDVRLT